jgi:hypothetical protein
VVAASHDRDLITAADGTILLGVGASQRRSLGRSTEGLERDDDIGRGLVSR